MIYLLLISSALFFSACSNRNDFDSIIINEFNKCPKQSTNCIVDLSKIMNFEWDTMYYFSGANSLEDMNEILGFDYKQFSDIGDRVIFLKNGKIVYQKEWLFNLDKELQEVIFSTNFKNFKVERTNAKFKIIQQGDFFYLEKL